MEVIIIGWGYEGSWSRWFVFLVAATFIRDYCQQYKNFLSMSNKESVVIWGSREKVKKFKILQDSLSLSISLDQAWIGWMAALDQRIFDGDWRDEAVWTSRELKVKQFGRLNYCYITLKRKWLLKTQLFDGTCVFGPYKEQDMRRIVLRRVSLGRGGKGISLGYWVFIIWKQELELAWPVHSKNTAERAVVIWLSLS